MILGILVIGGMIALVVAVFIKQGQLGEQRQEILKYISFDEETGVLTLHKRGPKIAEALSIVNDKNLIIGYTPVKLHIGSATVGGVTTGGAYTTGGQKVIEGSYENGYCRLQCTIWPSEAKMVNSIQIPSELHESAKKSNISYYLDDKMNIAVVEDGNYSLAEVLMMARTPNFAETFMGQRTLKRGYPKFEKCKRILDWLTDTDE